MSDFEKWWKEVGSGLRPLPDEDAEAHVHRVAAFAWAVGSVPGKLNHNEIMNKLDEINNRCGRYPVGGGPY